MTAARYIGVILAEHKRRGTPFEEAWLSALRSLPKGVGEEAKEQLRDWKVAISWAKLNFRAAYLNQPCPMEVSLDTLRALAEAFSDEDELALAA